MTHFAAAGAQASRFAKIGVVVGAQVSVYELRHQGYFQPAALARAARYAQVEKLLVERVSQRGIVRATGVSRMMVTKLTKIAKRA